MDSRDGRTASLSIGFDVEHWHQATLLRDEVANPVDRIEESVALVLDLLDRHETKATFFVVGEVAAKYPDTVYRIGEAGHELASHGHTHMPLFDRSPEWLEQELSASRGAIADASGVDPVGFRAPNFSITRETSWAFPVLAESGYRYDSSVFPVRTPMYGVSGAPVHPYLVRRDDPFGVTCGAPVDGGLVEFPLSVIDSWLRVPIAGGFYARLAPRSFLEYGIRTLVERGIPANVYFHPWEFNPAVRTNAPAAHKRFISFYGIDRLEEKVGHLLDSFEFGTVFDVLEGRGLLDTRSETPAVTKKEVLDSGPDGVR